MCVCVAVLHFMLYGGVSMNKERLREISKKRYRDLTFKEQMLLHMSDLASELLFDTKFLQSNHNLHLSDMEKDSFGRYADEYSRENDNNGRSETPLESIRHVDILKD